MRVIWSDIDIHSTAERITSDIILEHCLTPEGSQRLRQKKKKKVIIVSLILYNGHLRLLPELGGLLFC